MQTADEIAQLRETIQSMRQVMEQLKS